MKKTEKRGRPRKRQVKELAQKKVKGRPKKPVNDVLSESISLRTTKEIKTYLLVEVGRGEINTFVNQLIINNKNLKDNGKSIS